MSNKTIKTKKKYNRISRFYNILEYPFEKLVLSTWRRNLFSGFKGKVLEIGVGTGKNLQYYPKDVDFTGIDISEGMLKKAIEEKNKLNKDYRLIHMDAQNLQFKDNSFDIIVGTFVLCSIPDPVKALMEIKRVVKKDGKIILLEHVLSKNKILAAFQHLHNPFTSFLFGFDVNRDTKTNILKADLRLLKDHRLALYDVFRRFECSIKSHKS